MKKYWYKTAMLVIALGALPHVVMMTNRQFRKDR